MGNKARASQYASDNSIASDKSMVSNMGMASASDRKWKIYKVKDNKRIAENRNEEHPIYQY